MKLALRIPGLARRAPLSPSLVLAALVCGLPLAAARPSEEDVQESRELAGIAEEQALLLRQTQRLRSTMDVLLQRIEAEGRGRTAELLRDALALLDERSAEAQSSPLTMEERMDQARTALEEGQLVQSLERQTEIVRELESLLSILLDRRNMEDLDERLDEVRELQREAQRLADRESALRQKTQELRASAANEAQRALEQELGELREAEAELLRENEALGRANGTFELERLEARLEQLQADQTTDAEVLAAWRPEDADTLRSAAQALDDARREAQRAARARGAARELERAATMLRSQPSEAALADEEQHFAEAATQAERASRISGDESAQRAAEGLRAAEEAMAAVREGERDAQEAAAALEALAAELAGDAAEGEQIAREARAEAARSTDELADSESAASAAAREARTALQAAENAAERGSENEARDAMERAAAAINRGQNDEERLGQALSASQGSLSERSEQLARGLRTTSEADGQGPSSEAREAAEELERAAEAMRQASAAARREENAEAAQSAEEARAALERAQAALSSARQAASQASAEASQRMAASQAQLAERAEELQDTLEDASLSPEARSAAGEALEQAEEAMRQAAEELSEGRSASAASSQREASQALEQAAQQAREGVQPSSAEDRERAEELAAEQAEVEEEILNLARRLEERENREAEPFAERAAEAAAEAEASLEEGELSQAEEEQRTAEQELRQAQRELEEEQDEYERLREEEQLFRIAEEVIGMRTQHRQAMGDLREIDAERTPGRAPSRAQKLRLRRVAREESALATRADELADAIEEERSMVTAELMRNVQVDLERIAREMGEEGDYQTGERTQSLQRDVEDALDTLLGVLQDEQARRQQEEQEQQQQQGENQEGEQENGLVPDTAELKLLRKLEIDVQTGVDELLRLYPELGEEDGFVDEFVLEDISRLAARHERITTLFRHLRSKVGIPDPPPVADEGQDDSETEDNR